MNNDFTAVDDARHAVNQHLYKVQYQIRTDRQRIFPCGLSLLSS